MKLLNVDLVFCDYGEAVYVLGKLYREHEFGIDWVELLRSNVVHISRVIHADPDSLAPDYRFPSTLSQIREVG